MLQSAAAPSPLRTGRTIKNTPEGVGQEDNGHDYREFKNVEQIPFRSQSGPGLSRDVGSARVHAVVIGLSLPEITEKSRATDVRRDCLYWVHAEWCVKAETAPDYKKLKDVQQILLRPEDGPGTSRDVDRAPVGNVFIALPLPEIPLESPAGEVGRIRHQISAGAEEIVTLRDEKDGFIPALGQAAEEESLESRLVFLAQLDERLEREHVWLRESRWEKEGPSRF